MSLLTSRVTVNDNNGGTGVTLSHTLIQQPPWFYCAERFSLVIQLLSHVFCYVDVVTQEHPIVGKRTDIDLINSTHNSVLEISQLSHIVLLFTVNDVSEPTISTLFPLQH